MCLSNPECGKMENVLGMIRHNGFFHVLCCLLRAIDC